MTVFNTGFAGILKSWEWNCLLWRSSCCGLAKFQKLESFDSIFLFIAVCLCAVLQNRVGRETIDRLSLKVPLFGDLIQKKSGGSFVVLLVLWPRSGVPILTALKLLGYSGKPDNCECYRCITARYSTRMISIAYKKSKFSRLWQFRWLVGEETGELDQMLLLISTRMKWSSQ